MPRFRKKPVVVEAHQFTLFTDGEALAAWCGGKYCGIKLPKEQRVIKINTREGEMEASIGDFIIQGVAGEFYPCKPDIFEKTYEKVSE